MDTPDRFSVSRDLLLTPEVHQKQSDFIQTPKSFTPKTPSREIRHSSPNSDTRHQRRLDTYVGHHNSRLERHNSRMENGSTHFDFPCLEAMEMPGIHRTEESKEPRSFSQNCQPEISTLGFNDILLNLELNLPKQETELDIQKFLINNPIPSVNQLLQFSDDLPTHPINVELKNGEIKATLVDHLSDSAIKNVTKTLPHIKNNPPDKATSVFKPSSTLPKTMEPLTATSRALVNNKVLNKSKDVLLSHSIQKSSNHQNDYEAKFSSGPLEKAPVLRMQQNVASEKDSLFRIHPNNLQMIPAVQFQDKYSTVASGKSTMFRIQQNNHQLLPLVKSQGSSSNFTVGKNPMFRLQPGQQPTYKSSKSATITSSSFSTSAKNQEHKIETDRMEKCKNVQLQETQDQKRLKEIGLELNNNQKQSIQSKPQISTNSSAAPTGIKTATNFFPHDKNLNISPRHSFPNSYAANLHKQFTPQNISQPLKTTQTTNHSKPTFSNQTPTINHNKQPFSNQTQTTNHSKQPFSNQTPTINKAKQTFSNRTSTINNAKQTFSNQTSTINNAEQTFSNQTSTINNVKQTFSNQTPTINNAKQTFPNQTPTINNAKKTFSNQTQIPAYQYMRPQTSSYCYPTVPSYHPYTYKHNNASHYNMPNYPYQSGNGFYSSYYQKQNQGFYRQNYANAYFNPYQQLNQSSFYPNMQANSNAQQASQAAAQFIYSSGNGVKRIKLSEAPTQVNKVSSSYFECKKNKVENLVPPVKLDTSEVQSLPNSDRCTNVKNVPQISVQNVGASKEAFPNTSKPENRKEFISNSNDPIKIESPPIISGSSITENCSKCKNLKSRIHSIMKNTQSNDSFITIHDTDDDSSEENVIGENEFGILCDDCGGMILEEEGVKSETNIEHSNLPIDKDNRDHTEKNEVKSPQRSSSPKTEIDVFLTNAKSLQYFPSNEISIFKSSPEDNLNSTYFKSENMKFVPQNKRSIFAPLEEEEDFEEVPQSFFELNEGERKRGRGGRNKGRGTARGRGNARGRSKGRGTARGRSRGRGTRGKTKPSKERKCWNCYTNESSAWYTHRRQPSNHLCEACYHYYKQRNGQERKHRTRQTTSGEVSPAPEKMEIDSCDVKPDPSEVPVFLPQAKLRKKPVESKIFPLQDSVVHISDSEDEEKATGIDVQIEQKNIDPSGINDSDFSEDVFGNLFDIDIGFMNDIVDINDTNKDAISYLEFLQNIDCSSLMNPGETLEALEIKNDDDSKSTNYGGALINPLKAKQKSTNSLSDAHQRKKPSKVCRRKKS